MRLRRLLALTRGALIALAALLIVASPAAAETPSEKADALLSGLIKTNDPGMAVLVAQDGKILFEKGYGLADRKHHLPIIPQTMFRIASLTLQFTASAILKLQEEGKLSVEDKLSKYIPDFPRGNEVTLAHLLTHTSGIRNYMEEADFPRRMTNATTTEAVIEEMKKAPYDFDPGAKWDYDDSGYVLLGYIVEKVSGQSYGDFLRENFFQPLGMTNTGVYRVHLGLPHEALGYSREINHFERALNMDPSWPGGAVALYSTVEDLYRWNEGLFSGRVLAAASLKEAFTPVKTKENQAFNRETGYGFGWCISRYRSLQIIWHGGGIPGFRSCVLRLPDEKFTVAVLANSRPSTQNGDPVELAYQLVDTFLENKLASPPVVNTNVSPQSYDALTGYYDVTPGQVLDHFWRARMVAINRYNKHLFYQTLAQPGGAEIFPESDTEFYSKVWPYTQFTFVKDSSGKAVKLILHEFGVELDARRVNEAKEH